MNATGLALTVLSSVGWGAMDVLRKMLSERMPATALFVLLLVGQLPVFVVWLMVDGGFAVGAEYWGFGIADATVAVISNLIFLYALRIAPLSLSIPMLSLTPAFAVGIAGALIGEWPERLQLIGVGVVVVGALVLSWPKQDATTLRGWLAEPGVWLMALVSAMWAGTLTLDKLALAHTSTPMHAILVSLLQIIGTLGVMAVRGELVTLTQNRDTWPTVGVTVLCGVVATGAQMLAVQLILVSLVEAIKRAVGLALAAINGRLFFGEAVTARTIVAIIMMALGVVLASVR
ncbi:MAG: DMT family transporter [Myxococcota bacterium]